MAVQTEQADRTLLSVEHNQRDRVGTCRADRKRHINCLGEFRKACPLYEPQHLDALACGRRSKVSLESPAQKCETTRQRELLEWSSGKVVKQAKGPLSFRSEHEPVGLSELEEALDKLGELRERAGKLHVAGGRPYNPGWNMATDLPSMLTVSTAIAQGALARKESRGGHTRDDYPGPDPELGKVNIVQRQTGERGYAAPIQISAEPLPAMPAELQALLEEGH